MRVNYVWFVVLGLAGWVVTMLLERARVRRVVLLLSEVDDKKLVFGVFDRVLKTREAGSSAAAWPEHESVVALAIETSAIIGNGGFSFLFGSNLEVDPTYLLSLRALDAVGADAAAAAYRDALELFPNGSVPADLDRRRDAVSQFDEAELSAIDDRFFSAQRELTGQVAAYVRAHRAEFEAVWKGAR
ncbi:MAG: DUF4375 domain-containing protein [Polyangiaceae bacterium]